MRSSSAPVWLLGAISLAACAASPGPAGPGASAEADTVAVPEAPAPPRSATAPATATPPSVKETACFAKPVVFAELHYKGAPKPREIKPVDDGLPRKLAACHTDDDPEVCRLTVARVYFEANRFEEAGPILRDIALAGEVGLVGARAGQLYLECLNVLGSDTEPPRQACFDEMSQQVAPMKVRHCASPAPAPEIAGLCTLLDKIQRDLDRLEAEELVKKADYRQDDEGRLPLYHKAGDAYMALFEKGCAFRRPDPAKKPQPPPGWSTDRRCDEIAYNAMRAYMAAHEMDLAKVARAALVDPVNQLDKGELAKKAQKLDLH